MAEEFIQGVDMDLHAALSFLNRIMVVEHDGLDNRRKPSQSMLALLAYMEKSVLASDAHFLEREWDEEGKQLIATVRAEHRDDELFSSKEGDFFNPLAFLDYYGNAHVHRTIWAPQRKRDALRVV